MSAAKFLSFHQLAAAGSANTKGAYTQYQASLASDFLALILHIGFTSGASQSVAMDISTGAAGAETVVVADVAFSNSNFWAAGRPRPYIPVGLASGARLSARSQNTTASATNDLTLTGITGTSTTTTTATYGALTSSLPPTVDPGGTAETEGAYTQLTASSTLATDWQCATVNGRRNTGVSTAYFTFVIGTGAAGAEVTRVKPGMNFCSQTSANTWGPSHFELPFQIPISTRVAVRGQCSTTSSPARLWGAQILAGVTPSVGSGFVFAPPTSLSMETSGRTNHVKASGADALSAYSQDLAATSFDHGSLQFHTWAAVGSQSYYVTIATGAAGSEVVRLDSTPQQSDTADGCPHAELFPLGIPVSTRVASRIQGNAGGTQNLWIGLGYVPGVNSGGTATTYGLAANTNLTQVDPGGTANTKGAYVQYSAASTAAMTYASLLFAQRNSAPASCGFFFDLSSGAAGAEVAEIPDAYVVADTSPALLAPLEVSAPVTLATSTRLAVRAQVSITDATDRLMRVGIYTLNANFAPPAARVTQHVVELLSWPVPPAPTRTTQLVTEILSAPTATPARVSQLVVEAITVPVDRSPARVTQTAVELITAQPRTRTTQLAVEVLSAPVVYGRATQVLAELLTPRTTSPVRLTQAPVETLLAYDAVPLRLTQAPIEVLFRYASAPVRLAQAAIEIVYAFGCYTYRPPPCPTDLPFDDAPAGGSCPTDLLP